MCSAFQRFRRTMCFTASRETLAGLQQRFSIRISHITEERGHAPTLETPTLTYYVIAT